MRDTLKSISIIFTLFIFSCTDNETPDIGFPDNIELGTTQVYLNGEQVDYEPNMSEDTINNQLILTFRHEPEQAVLNSLGFSALAVEEGNFDLHDTRELYIGARANFTQIVNAEFDGWDYTLDRADAGFFHISSLDQENLIIQGKFKAYFVLESKNGFEDTGLPENVKFECIFHEYYERG